jgi:hypothetical protein
MSTGPCHIYLFLLVFMGGACVCALCVFSARKLWFALPMVDQTESKKMSCLINAVVKYDVCVCAYVSLESGVDIAALKYWPYRKALWCWVSTGASPPLSSGPSGCSTLISITTPIVSALKNYYNYI